MFVMHSLVYQRYYMNMNHCGTVTQSQACVFSTNAVE